MELVVNGIDPVRYHELREACGLKPIEPRLVKTALEKSLMTLCALIDKKPAGMLRLVGDGALTIVLCDVMVIPEHRRRGIGGAMIDAALDWVSRCMPDGKWVSVMLTCAEERQDYYKRFGFRPFDDGVQGCAMQAFVKGIDTGGATV